MCVCVCACSSVGIKLCVGGHVNKQMKSVSVTACSCMCVLLVCASACTCMYQVGCMCLCICMHVPMHLHACTTLGWRCEKEWAHTFLLDNTDDGCMGHRVQVKKTGDKDPMGAGPESQLKFVIWRHDVCRSPKHKHTHCVWGVAHMQLATPKGRPIGPDILALLRAATSLRLVPQCASVMGAAVEKI